MITDPLYNPAFSNFCYETRSCRPIRLTWTRCGSSLGVREAYNAPDCAYPDATPAILRVDGDGPGPYVRRNRNTHTLTISALGNQLVPNHA